MKCFLCEQGSTGREFDNIQDFLDAISDLAATYEENGEDCFEIRVEKDQEEEIQWKNLKGTQTKI